ncbi:(S)-beta-bisabolene synthase [Caligus rogercresseyi]|uniref:(S)-beta-bisabolene synthase n=1 Tax=Caligus rogercresseyi TaxID=217165 RepID=A0A7T8HJ28_CALRO|nr:(S)-beta-bisabolene synthase [Caligus rogercresseyi]
MCLCSSHTNVKFAFEDAVENCKCLKLDFPPYDHYVDLVEGMLCPEETRSRACLKEECDKCGPETLNDTIFLEWIAEQPSAVFKYRSVEKDENGRLGVQVKSGSPAQFAEHFKKKIRGFARHRFVAKNQKDALNHHLKDLDLDSLVIISDYAEKYAAKEFEEVQSLHWGGSALITIFTSVALFHAWDQTNCTWKKVKVYFSFFSERPEQDHYMASHCLERIVKWINQKFRLTFKAITFCSDKCAGQFCNRKVFGAIAQSRRHLCVNHNISDPLCPDCPLVTIHFSCAGHGKCEVDHVGALSKTSFRKEELKGKPLRKITDIDTHVQTHLNFVNLEKTQAGQEDKNGFFYSGFHGEVVAPESVSVSQADWERVDGTRDLHQLHTTTTPGELLTRESSCFSCPECFERKYEDCRRTEELGPVHKVMVSPISTTVAIARAATRTRSGQSRHRAQLANMATSGSVIAVSRGQYDELEFVQVIKSCGELRDPNLLKGKILNDIEGLSNCFSITGAKILTFDSSFIRSPPLHFVTSSVLRKGKQMNVLKIIDCEFDALLNDYLM